MGRHTKCNYTRLTRLRVFFVVLCLEEGILRLVFCHYNNTKCTTIQQLQDPKWSLCCDPMATKLQFTFQTTQFWLLRKYVDGTTLFCLHKFLNIFLKVSQSLVGSLNTHLICVIGGRVVVTSAKRSNRNSFELLFSAVISFGKKSHILLAASLSSRCLFKKLYRQTSMETHQEALKSYFKCITMT